VVAEEANSQASSCSIEEVEVAEEGILVEEEVEEEAAVTQSLEAMEC
jgi:hypothetical protein